MRPKFDSIKYPKLNLLGVMSGTSCDGLDLCLSEFIYNEFGFDYQIIKCIDLPYPEKLRNSLKNAIHLSAFELQELDRDWAGFVSDSINAHFTDDKKERGIDWIAVHGHTVFHQPDKGITLQIGNLDCIAAKTKCPVIGDFRTLDVALGGQGAPLVPVGDELLFNNYDACINLGGFANVSYNQNGERIAFDITPCNLLLNHIAHKEGLDYDEGGELAKKGIVIPSLLKLWNSQEYYKLNPPKSLGIEWLNEHIIRTIPNDKHSYDLMRTAIEHIACQIAQSLPKNIKSIFFTGGGVFNHFLMDRIAFFLKETSIVIPSKQLIVFKEALIFGFLGFLRVNNISNVWKSCTGANSSSVSGHLIQP